MLKIRKEVDLEILKEQYGFKTKKSEDQVFLIFCDEEGNELIIYPFADGLIQMLINVSKRVSNSFIDVSQSGVCKKLHRLLRDNKIYVQEEK